MIKKIQRDFGQNYYNILQLILLAILNELHIIAGFFGVYNDQDQSYNIRKLMWWFVLFTVVFVFLGSIMSTCGLIWYKLI